MKELPIMRNPRLQLLFVGLLACLLLSGCGNVHVGPPVVEHYGIPIYQVGPGLAGDMTPEEAALVRGRVTMNELRHNELGEDFNLNRTMDTYTYPPE